MPIILLGLIALVAALLLIYSSRKSGAGSRAAKRVQSAVVPEKRYEKSEDGKVVYLFGNRESGSSKESTAEQESQNPTDEDHDTKE